MCKFLSRTAFAGRALVPQPGQGDRPGPAKGLQHFFQEGPGSRMAGRREEFVRRARFNDVARIHEDDPTGNFTRKRHFMGDDNHRHTLFGQFAHGTQHLAGQFRIKR